MRAPRFLVLLVAVALALAACGGSSESGEEGTLDSLRSDAVGAGTTAAVPIITGALGIAARNAGTPLGDEAYQLAEETFLAELPMVYDPFSEYFVAGVSEVPPDATAYDPSVATYRNMLGFVAAVPAPYRANALAMVHEKLLGTAGDFLRTLDKVVADRQQWVSEMQSVGSTSASLGAGWAEHMPPALAYLRDVAVKAGSTPEFVAGWDALAAAATLASWEPETSDTDYADNTFTSSYTPAQVAACAQNVQELTAAVTAAHAAFPPAAQ